MQVGTVSISNYMHYSSDNYGVHCQRVNIGELSLYFSYNTIIGFEAPGTGGLVVCENCWSTTTGKHLNTLDGGNKKERLKSDAFSHALDKTLKKYKLISQKR